MAPKFAPTDLLVSKNCWLSAEDLTERIICPSLKAVLQFQGLLTIALKKAYGKPVAVECVRQSTWADAQGQPGLRRDVVLKVAEAPCVSASTLMPAQVIEAHPWLATLGGKPLGETLKKRVAYQRSLFEFTRFDAGLVLPTTAHAGQFAWARRSKFALASGDLLVVEVFFPGVLDQLRMNGHHKA